MQTLAAIAVSPNAMLMTQEVQCLVEDSGARVMFTSAALGNAWKPLVGRTIDAGRVVM